MEQREKNCDEQRSSHVMGRRAKKFSRAKCANFLWSKTDFAREKISSLFNITWLLRASLQIFFSSLFQNFTNFRSQVFSQPTVRTSLPTPRPQHRRKLTFGSFDMAQRCRPLCDFTSACAHQKPENWMMGVQLWTSKNPTVPQGRSEKFIFHPLPTSDSDIWLPQHLRPVAIQFW